jgi:hypothetical protein
MYQIITFLCVYQEPAGGCRQTTTTLNPSYTSRFFVLSTESSIFILFVHVVINYTSPLFSSIALYSNVPATL